MSNYLIKTAAWSELKQDAQSVRESVFIQEQNISAVDEWDSQDEISQHFVVYRTDEANTFQAIATARLLINNSVGRVAVLKAYRGKGIGRLVMQHIIEHAKSENRSYLQLSSQVHAIQFYQTLGFALHGDAYLDCGIPHIDMTLQLK